MSETIVRLTSLARTAIQALMKEHNIPKDVAIALIVVNDDEETKDAPFDQRLAEAVRIANTIRLQEGRDLLG